MGRVGIVEVLVLELELELELNCWDDFLLEKVGVSGRRGRGRGLRVGGESSISRVSDSICWSKSNLSTQL